MASRIRTVEISKKREFDLDTVFNEIAKDIEYARTNNKEEGYEIIQAYTLKDDVRKIVVSGIIYKDKMNDKDVIFNRDNLIDSIISYYDGVEVEEKDNDE